jgi:protein-tyrosine phosphatase
MTASFRILCVCTGNICRSPAAERLLRGALGPDIEVTSAGTLALVGRWIDSPMDRLIVLAGGDVSGFEARMLREPMLRAADLVLTMTDAHTGDVIEMWPPAVRKTYTLREFARLLGTIESSALPHTTVGERLRAALPLAAASRRPVADRTLDDVVDPYRQSDKVYEQAFDGIRDAVAQIAQVIVRDQEQERR